MQISATEPTTQVIVAALNEEEGIGPTIAELVDCLNKPSIIVVDGKSSDRTIEIARLLGAEILVQDGKGKGNAVAKAISSLNHNIKYTIITDADFTYPAKFLPEMINLLDSNSAVGMVCGNRFTPDIDKKALHKVFYFGNRLIAFTHNLLNGVELNDPLTGLRVIRTEILKDWKVHSSGFDIEVELNHYVERRGFKIVEVPILYRQRLGEKKLGVRHGQEIFKRMFLELAYETVHPLP